MENITEIVLSKHRNGPIGNVKLDFVKEYGKFLDFYHGTI
jgi:replicative DNA helicase